MRIKIYYIPNSGIKTKKFTTDLNSIPRCFELIYGLTLDAEKIIKIQIDDKEVPIP